MSNKNTFKRSIITTSILAGLYGTSASYAMTVDESSFGDFSNNFFDSGATIIDMPGITTLTGSLPASDNLDNFKIIGLPTGIQTINYSITTPADISITQVYIYADDTMGNENTRSNDPVEDFTTEGTFERSFITEASFNGNIRFEITGFYEEGGPTSYSIDLPTAPVPLPGAALLFASGLGALGAAKARRKAKRRA